MAHQFKEIVKHPEILRNLIYTLTMYNWKETQEYMKSVNWHWGSSNEGFYVTLTKNKEVEIKFERSDNAY